MDTDDPRQYLWRNICALVGGRSADRDPSINDVQRAVGVGRGTVQRIKEGDAATRLSSLVEIAANLRIPVWRLLVPPEQSIGHFSAQAMEMARLFDALPAQKQRQLFILVQLTQNPDAPVSPTETDATQPSGMPTAEPDPHPQRQPAVSRERRTR